MILEGKDDPKFYTARFDSIIKDEWKLLSVGGKSKVLELRTTIRKHPKYKNDRAYFFIDRDFDEIETLDDVYITPCYSIENLYCDPITVKRLVEAECGLTKAEIKNRDEIVDFLVAEYKKLQNNFHRNRKIQLLNSVFLYIRKIKNDKKISLDKVLKIETKIIKGTLILQLKKGEIFINQKTLEKPEFRKFIETCAQWKTATENPASLFRGKQEILLLRNYIDTLKHNGHLSDLTTKKYGVEVKIENPAMSNHVLSTTSQYVKTPECLSEFLLKINNQHHYSI